MIKQCIFLAAAAGALAAAPPAVAQGYQAAGEQAATGPNGEVVTVRPTGQVARRFYMPRDAVQEVRGEYAMEDGSTAVVTDRQRKLIVDFDNRRTELEAVGAYVFQSAADDMTLVYTKDGLGDDVIVLNYIPQRQVAGLPQRRVLLSSR